MHPLLSCKDQQQRTSDSHFLPKCHRMSRDFLEQGPDRDLNRRGERSERDGGGGTGGTVRDLHGRCETESWERDREEKRICRRTDYKSQETS